MGKTAPVPPVYYISLLDRNLGKNAISDSNCPVNRQLATYKGHNTLKTPSKGLRTTTKHQKKWANGQNSSNPAPCLLTTYQKTHHFTFPNLPNLPAFDTVGELSVRKLPATEAAVPPVPSARVRRLGRPSSVRLESLEVGRSSTAAAPAAPPVPPAPWSS